MAQDLRSFLKEYESRHPQEVLHIEREISFDQEVTAIAAKLEKEGKYPIIICHNVRLANGNISKFPLITNIFASRRRCAEVIKSSFEMVGRDYYDKTRRERQPVLKVKKEEAPVKEVVKTGAAVDLSEFPALKHHYMDPGPYFTAGFFTTFRNGIDNCALHRGWIVDRNKVRFYLTPHTHSRYTMDWCKEQGKEMRVAYWLGHHPAACLAAQAKLGYPESHFEAMGGMLGEPLRVVPSETLGEDFLVPADAEVVVEGIVRSYEEYPEGPLGEYTGYIGPQIPNPQFEVTAITHRKDAYWHDILVGRVDNFVMGGFALEGAVYEAVKQRIPSLKAVYLPLSGVCRMHVYLQLEKPRKGDAKEAIMSALPVDFRLKHVFVFDDDIDIYDDREVLFALATRTQWDDDVMVFRGCRIAECDPTAPDEGVMTKGGIDCTVPAGEYFSERNKVSEEVDQRIKLEDFVSAEILKAIPVEKQ